MRSRRTRSTPAIAANVSGGNAAPKSSQIFEPSPIPNQKMSSTK